MIDLRSDTVTRPTPAMRRAMAEAEVGDDVYGEDPTVNRLEQRAAEIAGKEAALFVPSGTMGNTIGIKVHTQHGQEVICEQRCHILNYELGHAGVVFGLRGAARRRRERHSALGRIFAARSGRSARTGRPPALVSHREHGQHGRRHGLSAGGDRRDLRRRARTGPQGPHGWRARLQCRRVVPESPVRDIVAPVDTVMFCLSKALGAPVGSMLAGPEGDDRAGAALSQAPGRRHAPGRRAGRGGPGGAGRDAAEAGRRSCATRASWPRDWRQIRGIQIDPKSVQSNIVIFDVSGTGIAPADMSARLKQRGVLMNGINPRQMRAVTHYDVDRAGCEFALQAIAEIAAGASRHAGTA